MAKVPPKEIRVVNGRIYVAGQDYPTDKPAIKEEDKATTDVPPTPVKPKQKKKN